MNSPMKKKMALFALGVAAIIPVASCGGAAVTSSSAEAKKSYTYRTYLSTSPTKWNTHNWQTSDESYITAFTEMGFYDTVLNSTKDGYDFVTEMAAEYPKAVDPTDLTDDELDTYFVKTGNAAERMVWDIKLNQAAKWEDGTAITSKDYVDSMERQLNPKFANFRADSYYSSNFVIANAEAYYKSGQWTTEAAYDYVAQTEDGTPRVGNENFDGFWYINLGAYSPYAASYFSNADDSTNFYTILNNRSSKASDAVELAARRITYGVAYYLWKYVNHEQATDKSDWDEVKKPSDVSSTMFTTLKNKMIDIDDFDNQDVYTCKTDSSEWTSENQVLYSTDDLKKDLKTFVSGIGRGGASAKSWAWELPLFINILNADAGLTQKDIGIKALDDYTLRLYLAKPISNLDLKFSLCSSWLVNVPLYDKLTTTTATGSKGTTYATNKVENYISYGPYKLTEFIPGSSMKMERNENWYGYSDGKHEGQFQMTAIETKIIKDHNTAFSYFLKGDLDDIDLQRSDMGVYGNSGRRSTTYESYTQKISFNSKWSKLRERQSSGVNKTVLSNINFRKGLSLFLNRDDFASTATSGSKGFTGLLNDLYLANNATGESYRSTAQGKSVYNMVYGHLGGDTIDEEKGAALPEKSNGYNRSLAIQYVAKGLAEELNNPTDGHLNPNDTIDLEFRVYDNESDNTKNAYTFLLTNWTSVIDEAKAILVKNGDLPADNKLDFTISMVKDEDYYTSAQNGAYEMIFSTWGGAAINPYGLMQVYMDSTFTSTCEFGFKGTQNNVELSFDSDGDGVKETKTFDAWYHFMNDSLTEAAFDDEIYAHPEAEDYAAWKKIHDQRLTVLANCEAAIINRYEAIPIVARGTSSLLGFKVENATKTYVSMIGYGGIRLMSFNYSDDEWAQFVKDNKGDLASLYASYRD
ncbi:MAG: hypothetical protein II721_06015 [Bacilli bacterium]|nr:hypothetical protein [Bacilli bacterium]